MLFWKLLYYSSKLICLCCYKHNSTMKLRLFSQLLTGGAIAFTTSATITQPGYAQNATYYCGTSRGAPATFARTTRGDIPIIRWVSTDLPPPLTAQQRCEEVSRRFQVYHDNGTLKYITTGQMDGQPAICVANRQGGDCTGLLFTLKPGSNPKRTLLRLLDRRGLAGGNTLNETGTRRIYVDVTDYLERVPLD